MVNAFIPRSRGPGSSSGEGYFILTVVLSTQEYINGYQ